MPTPIVPPQERFFNHIDKPNGDAGCWLWTGGLTRNGYGRFKVNRATERAHRWSYQHFVGAIPEGLQVLHNCPDGDNRRCVNPAHLFLGTNLDNMRDKAAKGRAASGENNGMNLHPEARLTGDQHWSRQRPDETTKGEDHGQAKLTEADVLSIRARYAAGEASQHSMAAEYGVAQSTIRQVIIRRTWKHLD